MLNHKFSILSLVLVLSLKGCGDESAFFDGFPSQKTNNTTALNEEESGVFLQILLEDQEGQELSYMLFNPTVSSINACEASAELSIDGIVSRLPEEYRLASVTGWSCSLTNPESGKRKIDRVK